MFEKETRLKIEWQDPKTMRDLDTYVCCPRRWIMLASTYWTCLSKNYSLSSFTFTFNAQNAPLKKKNTVSGKHQTSGANKFTISLSFYIILSLVTKQKTCRPATFEPFSNPWQPSSLPRPKSLNFDGDVGETWSKDALVTRAWKKEICFKNDGTLMVKFQNDGGNYIMTYIFDDSNETTWCICVFQCPSQTCRHQRNKKPKLTWQKKTTHQHYHITDIKMHCVVTIRHKRVIVCN